MRLQRLSFAAAVALSSAMSAFSGASRSKEIEKFNAARRGLAIGRVSHMERVRQRDYTTTRAAILSGHRPSETDLQRMKAAKAKRLMRAGRRSREVAARGWGSQAL